MAVEFVIEAKLFNDSYGNVWRGRAISLSNSKTFNFLLPLSSTITLQKAEAATVYELLGILPQGLDPEHPIILHIRSEETKIEIMSSPILVDMISSLNLAFIVMSGTTNADQPN